MDFFPYTGMQCTAVAFMFLLFTMQQEPNFQNIASRETDHVLLEGTALYGSIIANRPPDETSPYLGVRVSTGQLSQLCKVNRPWRLVKRFNGVVKWN